jgi:hypothetical protein
MVSSVALNSNVANVVASATTTPTIQNGPVVSAHGMQSSSSGWTPGSGQTERMDAANFTANRSITVTDKSIFTITFDAVSSGGCSANCDNNTNWSHTVSGSNRGILVFLQAHDSCTYRVLYNNTAMTEVGETASFDGSMRTYAYKMENPATSATGVSVSSNPNCGFEAGAVSYSGVDQMNMIDTAATSTSPSNVVASVTTTPAVANDAIVSAHGMQSSSSGWTPGSGQTERMDAANFTANRSITVTEVLSAAAGVTVQMTSQGPDPSKPTGSIVVALKH